MTTNSLYLWSAIIYQLDTYMALTKVNWIAIDEINPIFIGGKG